MFLGRFKDARDEYVAHRREMINENGVGNLGRQGFRRPAPGRPGNKLMTEIENEIVSARAKPPSPSHTAR